MIKADIPFDVTEYKEQVFLGMTSRQIISIILCLLIGIPTFIFGSKILSADVMVYVVLIEVIPLAGVGFFTYQGMPFEEFLQEYIEFEFGQQTRTMKYLPPEVEIHDEVRKMMLVAEIKQRKLEIKEEKSKAKYRKKKGDVKNGKLITK